MSLKIRKSKVKIVVDKILSIIFLILGGMGLLFNTFLLSFAIFGSDTDLSIIIIFSVLDLLAFLMFRWGYKTNKLIILFKSYAYIISSSANGKLSNIASILGKSEATITKELKTMINKKYFANAYIDYNTKQLIIAGKSLDTSNLSKAISTRCTGCGAISRNVIGNDNYCEYCGTLLING